MPKDCYVVQPLKVWSKKKCFTHIIPENSGLTQSLEEINLSKVFFFGVGASDQSMSNFFQ